MATKNTKHPIAGETTEAPIGAREIFAIRTEFFALFCGQPLPAFRFRSMATKNTKGASAIEGSEAPIGARKISSGRKNVFVFFVANPSSP